MGTLSVEGRPLEDTQLVERPKRGNTEAYRVLVQRYQELAVRVGYLVTGEVAAPGNEQRTALLAALIRLLKRDRLVIAYRCFFDRSETEMVQALGVACRTVKPRLSRALERRRESFRYSYPLLIAAPDIDASMREALVDLAAHLPPRPIRDLSNAVLRRIAAGRLPLRGHLGRRVPRCRDRLGSPHSLSCCSRP